MSASAGRVLLLLRGTYDSSVTYYPMDGVYYQGSTYVCKQESTGYLPTNTTYFQILAQGSASASVAGNYYGACDTAASTAAKVVTIPVVENFVLQVGDIIGIKFDNTNTAQDVTLNVNNTGAFHVFYGNATVTTSNLFAGGEAGRITLYQYDGTNWVWISHDVDEVTDDTKTPKTDIAPLETSPSAHNYRIGELLYYNGVLYKAKIAISVGDALTVNTNIETTDIADVLGGGGGSGYHMGTSSTAAATAAKVVVTTNSDYFPSEGAGLFVKFDYDNTAIAVTLNVDDSGAKALQWNGSAVTASAIKAGVLYNIVYDGTYYQIVGSDAESTNYDDANTGIGDNLQESTDNLVTALSAVEIGSTASAVHAVGDYFLWNGQLVKTTVYIPVGSTITLNANVVTTTIAEIMQTANNVTALLTDRTRNDITSRLANLPQAIAERNLEKYGYKIGDYFTGASDYTYHLADLNPFKGTSTPYCINVDHCGIVVDTHTTSQWHSGSAASVGYNGSVLHSYLKGTVLTNIKSDITVLFGSWNSHLLSHSKLLTTATASWAWQADQYISALTATQCDAGSQCTMNGYQEGEASKSLELFRKYKWTEIFGSEYSWLRNLGNNNVTDTSASYACFVTHNGSLDGNGGVTYAYYAVGLINFH